MEPIITDETPSDLTRLSGRMAIWLAMAATATALCISALAGWQRGGSHAERSVWVALSLVLVLSAHLLPALVRGAPLAVRAVAGLLWIACTATACYGHATFFVLAQQHAGELRASSVTADAVPGGVTNAARGLTVVMAERATVVAQLATARARDCAGHCAGLEARRVTLAARRDALDAEADDIWRRRAEGDRLIARRDALLADPVTSRLAILLGVTVARVDLLSGLSFAAVLEGLACLLWTVALQSSPLQTPVRVATGATPTQAVAAANAMDVAKVTAVTDMTARAVTGVTSSHPEDTVSTVTPAGVTASHAAPRSSHTSRGETATPLPEAQASDDEVNWLAREVQAGRIRPTVSDIRRHLRCSQAKAASLRRQLGQPMS